jgi:hypothetical protein
VNVPPAKLNVAPAEMLNPAAPDDPPCVTLKVPVWTCTVPLLTNGAAIVDVPVPAVLATVPALEKETVPRLP